MGAEGGPTATEEPLKDYAEFGGRALTSMVINREVPPDCHPFSSDNKIVIAPGLLSGTTAVMSGRISIGCKSPLTGTIKESNAGGQGAQVLARLGYAAIILEGKPQNDDIYKIFIHKNVVQITSAGDLKLLGNYDTVEKLIKIYGNKIACLTIGPAGEYKMCAASVALTDMELRPTRHAARGGIGAVMGSKGVKAIILDDTGCPMRSPQNPDAFKKANRKFVEGIKNHPVTGKGLPTYGTNILTNIINEAGGYPTHNFMRGHFENASYISGETQVGVEISRGGKTTQGCHRGCIIRCSGTYVNKDGSYLTKQPEYETVWAHGGNCGIDDLDAIAMLDRLDDDFGIDTIEMGAAIAVAMEAGVAKFGDAKAAINLVKEVGKGTYLGRILGNGAKVTGQVFGVERIPVVKGQAMPAYDPRSVQGIGVTYATSTMGADHTAGYTITANILGVGENVDPLKPEGQVELSRNLQIATAAVDSTGMCLFTAFALLDQPATFQALIDMINAFYGLKMTADDVVELGKKILKTERDFNTRAGFTANDDRLPSFFLKEKLPPHHAMFMVKNEDLDQVFNF